MPTERELEQLIAKKTFKLPIPVKLSKPSKIGVPVIEKTSLFVPKKILWEKAGFRPASFSDKVFITRNVPAVMEVIFKNGAVAPRYGINGLENDPSRQQIIVYALVVCQNHLLWYQRATPQSVTKNQKKYLGDARLYGKYSVGFGGHKTKEDIGFGKDELSFIKDLLPALQDELGTILGLNKGFFNEVQEELGLQRAAIRNVKLLGAFYDERFEDPSVEIQVGWVHTGIAAVIEVDPDAIDSLTFSALETAKAWWVPFDQVEKELLTLEKAYNKGEGAKVETWSNLVLKEFWPDYFVNL